MTNGFRIAGRVLLTALALLIACAAPTPPLPVTHSPTPFPTEAPTETAAPAPGESAVPTAPFSTATNAAPTLSPTAEPTSLPGATPTTRSNIVFILTDDLDVSSVAYMPKLKQLLADQGTSFSNFFVNVSLCCPSRATILRGQYMHNTQIFSNKPPSGGFLKFYRLGLENSTVATWLQAVGYRTVLLGKYLNGYPEQVPPTYIPPGWDEWYSPAAGNPYSEFNYTLNENGRLVPYGNAPADYQTDVLSRKAADFISRAANTGAPFFMYLATYAPHLPATPAPRHAQLFENLRAPRPPSYNEADVSDKPMFVSGLPLLKKPRLQVFDDVYRKRVQSLQAVDDLIENLINVLQATGQLDHTYIFFSSDNGFHFAEHRLLAGKQTPYEEDIRVPLIVRGPGVPVGATVPQLAGNDDFAPTFAQLAGAPIPEFVDGRSLLPLWSASASAIQDWRNAFLIEYGSASAAPSSTPSPTRTDQIEEPPDKPKHAPGSPSLRMHDYSGLRTQDYMYVEYTTGERELYDLRADPYELQNLYRQASPTLLDELASRLAELRGCAGAQCQTVEDAPFNSR